MVGKICTVCKSSSFINKDYSFFTYPGDPQRRFEWLKAVDRLDLLDKLANQKTRGNHRICEAHFEEKYVKRSTVCESRKFLTKDAFPTRSLEAPNLIVPMTSENFKRPPCSLLFWNHSDLENIKKEELGKMDEKKENRRIPSRSPQHCTDLSEFCESIIKVSKSTQTLDFKRKLPELPECTIKRIKVEENAQSDKKTFMLLCSKFLPDNMQRIISWHLGSNKKKVNINLFALYLYFSGGHGIVKNILNLPTLNELRQFLVPKTTNSNDNIINAFKIKVDCMSAKEKVCAISVSSMYLKPQLYYNIKFDRLIGLHDVDGDQTPHPAKYAVFIMVQGLLVNWKQPIAYSFISEYDNYPEISTWIDEVITTLIDIGLDLRAFVSDPKSEFLYLSESRFVTPDKTYFCINDKKIYYFYDTKQLLKIVKNNLKSCDFHYNGKITRKGDIDVFKNVHNLCDILNSKTLSAESHYKRAFMNKKYQTTFMNKMLKLFQNLKIVRKLDSVDVTENMKFVDGFQITISSVMQLFDELKEIGTKYLLTNRLGHASVNRFFMRVKKLSGTDECTARHFNKCFTRGFVFNMMKRPIGPSTDTPSEIEDHSQQLLNGFQFDRDSFNKPLRVFVADYRFGLPEKNAFVYVCGYCYLKCLQRHCCDTLKSYLKHHESKQENLSNLCNVNLDLKFENCNILPPDTFMEFMMTLETKFQEYFKTDNSISSIGQEIMRKISLIKFDMPCPCFPIDYLKALFIRVRIFYMVRKNNKIFNKKKGAKIFKVFSL